MTNIMNMKLSDFYDINGNVVATDALLDFKSHMASSFVLIEVEFSQILHTSDEKAITLDGVDYEIFKLCFVNLSVLYDYNETCELVKLIDKYRNINMHALYNVKKQSEGLMLSDALAKKIITLTGDNNIIKDNELTVKGLLIVIDTFFDKSATRNDLREYVFRAKIFENEKNKIIPIMLSSNGNDIIEINGFNYQKSDYEKKFCSFYKSIEAVGVLLLNMEKILFDNLQMTVDKYLKIKDLLLNCQNISKSRIEELVILRNNWAHGKLLPKIECITKEI